MIDVQRVQEVTYGCLSVQCMPVCRSYKRGCPNAQHVGDLGWPNSQRRMLSHLFFSFPRQPSIHTYEPNQPSYVYVSVVSVFVGLPDDLVHVAEYDRFVSHMYCN